MGRLWGGFLSATLLLAGCTSSGEPAGPAPDVAQAETEAPEQGPIRGGTVVAAISSDPGHLNPAITTSGGTHTASELLYNGLVSLDARGRPEPDLAESWELADDGATYTFTLREGVTWHDGEPFTAADVKWTFEEALLKYHARTRASMGPALEAVEAPDARTVVFRFAYPYAPLLQQLDVTEAPILPEHVYEGTDPEQNEEANTNPIGTGPFRFVSYTPDTEIRLERNPDYFKDGLPYLDAVVMRVIPDDASQVLALEAGEVDWLWGAPGPELRRLESDERFGTLETARNPGGANCIMTVSFNLERPMLADVDTRRGLAQALNREMFLERVLFGDGAVATAPIHSGIGFAHAKDVQLPAHDLAAADRTLTEAGWVRNDGGTRTARGVDGVPDGTPLAFDFVHFPNFAPYGELVRAQLSQVGADVELRALEPPVFASTVFTDRDFDTNIVSYCNGNDPEIGVRRMYTSDNIGKVPFTNAAAYRNPEVDRLFDAAQRAVDNEERRRIYGEIQRVVARELPYYWLVETVATRVFDAACDGFRPDGHFAETAYCQR